MNNSLGSSQQFNGDLNVEHTLCHLLYDLEVCVARGWEEKMAAN